MTKKKTLLLIAGAAVLVLIAVPAFLLYQGISRFSHTEQKLRRSVNSLKQYYRQDPFPSPQNLKKVKENTRTLEEWFDSLTIRLSRGQQEIADKSPTAFMGLLSDTENRLIGFAEKTGVDIPENFAFGFNRYDGGVPPSPNDVPKLTLQLAVVETVCRVLFAARADGIVSIRREEFEGGKAAGEASSGTRPGGRPSARRRPGARRPTSEPPRKPGPDGTAADLYEVLHFTVRIKAKEAAVVKILNLLARLKMFIVVTQLELAAEGPDLGVRLSSAAESALASAADAGAEPGHVPSRRERMVCGPRLETPMSVALELDVYRFRNPSAPGTPHGSGS